MTRVTKTPPPPPAPEPLSANAWALVAVVLVAVLVVGYVGGVLLDGITARQSCSEACAPRAPAYTEGRCYCSTTKELP